MQRPGAFVYMVVPAYRMEFGVTGVVHAVRRAVLRSVIASDPLSTPRDWDATLWYPRMAVTLNLLCVVSKRPEWTLALFASATLECQADFAAWACADRPLPCMSLCRLLGVSPSQAAVPQLDVSALFFEGNFGSGACRPPGHPRVADGRAALCCHPPGVFSGRVQQAEHDDGA